jgi:hypothetical protein
MDQTLLLQLLPFVVGLNVLLIGLCIWLTLRVSKLTQGSGGQSLESHIHSILQTHQTHTKTFTDHVARLQSLEQKIKNAVRHVSAIRFDPLDGMGDGKQSFALAILDEEGNGAVISSLNARDRVRVFAKPIQNFTSSHELSEEEKRAIAGNQK